LILKRKLEEQYNVIMLFIIMMIDLLQAVWQEINSLKLDIVRQSESNRGIYRPDENILVSEPTVLRQIVVPCRGEKEYVTDNGLVIPSITLNLHRQLIGAADRLGISWERRVGIDIISNFF